MGPHYVIVEALLHELKKHLQSVTLLGLPGKAKKQEIRRVHNSNMLQRHSHVQMLSLAFYKVIQT